MRAAAIILSVLAASAISAEEPCAWGINGPAIEHGSPAYDRYCAFNFVAADEPELLINGPSIREQRGGWAEMLCYKATRVLSRDSATEVSRVIGMCFPFEGDETPDAPPSGEWSWTVSKERVFVIDRSAPSFRDMTETRFLHREPE